MDRAWTPGLAMAAGVVAVTNAAGAVALPAGVAIVTALVAVLFPAWIVFQSRESRARIALMRSEGCELRARLDLDPLTELMNRAAFKKALDRLAAANPNGGGVVILFFDLDRFKDVNDTLGHKVGDQLLIEVARRAAAVLSDAVAFARLGGDEFAAIVHCAGSKRAEDYGHAIVEVMNEPFQIEDRAVEVAASVGIAIGDTMLDDGHELLRRADLAMYEAKGARRGGCRIYDDALDVRHVRESSIRVELGKSLIASDFALHYQPIVDARTGRLSSVEALLRAQSPALSDVPTSSLIAIAEESGQIMPLTEWTFDTALEAISALKNTPVAVNVSPVYFRHPDFVHRVFDKLVASKLRPELLTIEVTEGVLISDIAMAQHSISRLREIGVNVYLDDFGTGYSSLSYLQHFELDGLKLDKSFLREVGDKKKATQIIRSIIDFSHSLEMRVVVEGVESDWQARLLQLLGCDFLQGYELGVPMPLADLLQVRERLRLSQPTPGETAERPGLASL